METNEQVPRAHDSECYARLGAARLVALALLLVVALALRIHNLEAESLWFDESLSHHYTIGNLCTLIERVRVMEGNSPLYFVLLWGWVRVFGDTEAGMRSLSVFLDTVGLLLLFLVARCMGGFRIASLALAQLVHRLACRKPLL